MKFLLGFILLPAALIYGFQTPFSRPFFWPRSTGTGMFQHRRTLGTPHVHMVSPVVPQMRTLPHIPMENYRTEVNDWARTAPQFLMPTIKASNSMSHLPHRVPYSFHRMIVSLLILFKIFLPRT